MRRHQAGRGAYAIRALCFWDTAKVVATHLLIALYQDKRGKTLRGRHGRPLYAFTPR